MPVEGLRRCISDARRTEGDNLIGFGCSLRLLLAVQTALLACLQQRYTPLELAGVVL